MYVKLIYTVQLVIYKYVYIYTQKEEKKVTRTYRQTDKYNDPFVNG